MNMELAYKVQMLPAKIRESRTMCETMLLKSGWPRDVIDRDIAWAISWANSHCLTKNQEKQRRARARNKEILKGNDAVEAMFASAGITPNEILPKQDQANG